MPYILGHAVVSSLDTFNLIFGKERRKTFSFGPTFEFNFSLFSEFKKPVVMPNL